MVSKFEQQNECLHSMNLKIWYHIWVASFGLCRCLLNSLPYYLKRKFFQSLPSSTSTAMYHYMAMFLLEVFEFNGFVQVTETVYDLAVPYLPFLLHFGFLSFVSFALGGVISLLLPSYTFPRSRKIYK